MKALIFGAGFVLGLLLATVILGRYSIVANSHGQGPVATHRLDRWTGSVQSYGAFGHPFERQGP
jgi:hypothetical protein